MKSPAIKASSSPRKAPRCAALTQKFLLLSLPSWDDEEDDAPCEFRIFAFGETDTTNGSYSLDEESAAAVMKAASDYGNRLTIDYEHMAIQDPPVPAPAAGSFVLELRADGIYAADVKWTDKASQMLRSKEYLYFSPAFLADKKGRPARLLNVALTNLPATKSMTPLVAANISYQENRMETVLTALSLKNDASEAEALGAVVKLHDERRQVVELTGKSSFVEALATVAAWKQSIAEVTELRAKLAKQEEAARDQEFDAEISKAKSATLLAHSDEHKRNKTALAYRSQPNGIESLRSFLSALDPILALSEPAKNEKSEPATGKGTVVLTAEDKRIAKAMNVPFEALQKEKARLIANGGAPKLGKDEDEDNEDAA